MLFAHTIADNEAPNERRHVVELAQAYLRERNIPAERIFVVSAHEYDRSATRAARACRLERDRGAALRRSKRTPRATWPASSAWRALTAPAQPGAAAHQRPRKRNAAGFFARMFGKGR